MWRRPGCSFLLGVSVHRYLVSGACPQMVLRYPLWPGWGALTATSCRLGDSGRTLPGCVKAVIR
jgi:hypothetical protein